MIMETLSELHRNFYRMHDTINKSYLFQIIILKYGK